jgi:hypothetical protein
VFCQSEWQFRQQFVWKTDGEHLRFQFSGAAPGFTALGRAATLTWAQPGDGVVCSCVRSIPTSA